MVARTSLPPIRVLSSARRALGGDAAVVEDDHLVGEPVGLLEVLGGEHHRGAGGGELGDDRPQCLAGGGVEPGGGLVEEQDRRRGDQAGGEIDSAPCPARQLADPAVGDVVQLEPVDEIAGSASGRAAQPGQATDELEVLAAS